MTKVTRSVTSCPVPSGGTPSSSSGRQLDVRNYKQLADIDTVQVAQIAATMWRNGEDKSYAIGNACELDIAEYCKMALKEQSSVEAGSSNIKKWSISMLNGNSRFSLLLFNSKLETIRDALPLSEFPLLDELEFQPCGGTALDDAVTGLIKGIGAHARGRRSSALCVIVADGMENSSRYHRIEDVRQRARRVRLSAGSCRATGPEHGRGSCTVTGALPRMRGWRASEVQLCRGG